MKKHQPDLEVTLKFLKNHPEAQYVLPTTAYGRSIDHPKYSIFNSSLNVFFFSCKINETCYLECPCKCTNIFESKSPVVENTFLLLKNFAEKCPHYTFYIESFDKFGLHCCEDVWPKYKQRFESEFKNQNNVIFLWPDDNVNNT